MIIYFFQKYSKNSKKKKSESTSNAKIDIIVNTPGGRVKTPNCKTKRGSLSSQLSTNTTENYPAKRIKYSTPRKFNLNASVCDSPNVFEKTTVEKTPKNNMNKSSLTSKATSISKYQNSNLPKKLNNSNLPSRLPVKNNLFMNKNNLTGQTRIKASTPKTPKIVSPLPKTPLVKSSKKNFSTIEKTKINTPIRPKSASTLIGSSKKTFSSLTSGDRKSTKLDHTLVSKNKKSLPRTSSKNETNDETDLQLESSNKSLSLIGKRYSQNDPTKDIKLDHSSSVGKFMKNL